MSPFRPQAPACTQAHPVPPITLYRACALLQMLQLGRRLIAMWVRLNLRPTYKKNRHYGSSFYLVAIKVSKWPIAIKFDSLL